MVGSNDVSTDLNEEGGFNVGGDDGDKLPGDGSLRTSADISTSAATRVSKLSASAARTHKFCANESSEDEVLGVRHLKQNKKRKSKRTSDVEEQLVVGNS